MARRDPDRRLAVVIATRNRSSSLRGALAHLAQLPERPELVVVDNGSDDGTARMVARAYPAVRVIRLRDNLGAAGRNFGCFATRARYVAFADDDSWWAPGALAKAADLLDAFPRVALLAARVLVGERGALDPTCLAMAQSPLAPGDGLPGPRVLGFVACGAVVRRAAFLGAGGFQARFGVGGEERLLAIDLAAAGWQLCYVDGVVAHHHPSPVRDVAARRRTEVRNALWTAWLRRRPLGAVARTAHAVRRGLVDPASRAGLAAAVRDLPRVMRERRSVPRELDREIALVDGWNGPSSSSLRRVSDLLP